MKRFDSSSIGSTLVLSLVAGLFVLGGCTADTLTGTSPTDSEEVTVQEASHNQGASATDDGSNDKPDDYGHNQDGSS